jgi:hypothetical protein
LWKLRKAEVDAWVTSGSASTPKKSASKASADDKYKGEE